jgi:hypothetical protein
MTQMTRDDAASVINVVCWKLKIAPAKLHWETKGNRAKNGLYQPLDKTIFVGPHTWRGLDCLLHEIAHHVVKMKFGVACPLRNFNRAQHGREFQLMLLAVVKTWYGNPDLYSWKTEYKRIGQFGSKQKG